MIEHGALIKDDNNVSAGWKSNNISTQTTTAVKASAGILHAIVVNTPLASGKIEIFDNTAASGTSLGVITRPATLLDDEPISVIYDAVFSTGLTVKTSGANQDITVIYV